MKLSGMNFHALMIKQKQVNDNDEFKLSGKAFTLDNDGESSIEFWIGDSRKSKTLNAGEQFVIESVTDGYYPKLNFRINFTGTGIKQVFIWYPDYVTTC